jgi:hypothetical protein
VSAGAASSPAGGRIEIWVPNPGASGKIVITGAIGDYGTFTSVDKDGRANPNGNFVRIMLKRGSFMINSTALNAKANHTQPTGSVATCSAFLDVSDPVTLYDGSGAYAGIGGTLHITEVFAFIAPRNARGASKGKCNKSNSATPVAAYSSITGDGEVAFK